MFARLNSFVMKVVSLPMYLNMAQGCAAGFFSGCGGVCGVDFGGRIGKAFCLRYCRYFLLVGIRPAAVGRCSGGCIRI